ncbi:mCG127070 [Mus musculus]|nr:mCG127070 [Mus musculus]
MDSMRDQCQQLRIRHWERNYTVLAYIQEISPRELLSLTIQ